MIKNEAILDIFIQKLAINGEKFFKSELLGPWITEKSFSLFIFICRLRDLSLQICALSFSCYSFGKSREKKPKKEF